jgi:hypothetical protein
MQNISSLIHQNNSCSDIIDNLCKSVDDINTKMIDKMTNLDTNYKLVCVRPDLTYNYFFKCLKHDWEEIISKITHDTNCRGAKSLLLEATSLFNKANFDKLAKQLTEDSVSDLVYDNLVNMILHSDEEIKFEVKENIVETISMFVKVLNNNCQCGLIDIFKLILKKYKQKYVYDVTSKDVKKLISLLKKDFVSLKSILETSNEQDIAKQQHNIIESIASRFAGLYSFSVESELNKLIPEELGSLKKFFVKTISTYFNNLHPVIWAQIIKHILENVFKELPFTTDQVFQFVSKQVLLNSGPFILKILQTISPILTPELAEKYNLKKLEYPLLKPNQVDIILRRLVNNFELYNIKKHISASVGHVCIVNRADKPDDVFVIKIIKPIAIVQSCWEYKTLSNEFKQGTCEYDFIKNMLESNGRELNVLNEMNNVNKGYKLYNEYYSKVFGTSINASLSSVQVKRTIIPLNANNSEKQQVMNTDTWFAFAMTLAPGVQVRKLIESDALNNDTKFRAKLHRCADLLVYKFFYNILRHGFYHGDLHAGNMFFSYEHSRMTLIDFGSVGELDVHSTDPTNLAIIEILFMGVYYNYDGILDKLTELINSKCVDTKINTNSEEYKKLRDTLKQGKIDNMKNAATEMQHIAQYKDDIFSTERINAEFDPQTFETNEFIAGESMYSYLDYIPKGEEPIIENEGRLHVYPDVPDPTGMTFASILGTIVQYYATNGVNIAIKFNEFYQLQKAYALLLGSLSQMKYNPYRFGIVLRNMILRFEHLVEARHITLAAQVAVLFWKQRNEYYTLKESYGLSTKNRSKRIDQIYQEADIEQIEQYKKCINIKKIDK